MKMLVSIAVAGLIAVATAGVAQANCGADHGQTASIGNQTAGTTVMPPKTKTGG